MTQTEKQNAMSSNYIDIFNANNKIYLPICWEFPAIDVWGDAIPNLLHNPFMSVVHVVPLYMDYVV